MIENTNKIIIRGLEISTSIGIYDFEKNDNQPLIFSAEIDFMDGKLFQEDKIDNTLNYEQIISTIKKICASRHYNLLEVLGEDICTALLKTHDINSIRLQIDKPNVLKSEPAGIIGIELYRRQS